MLHPPLTQLIADLMGEKRTRILRTDPATLASHYGLREDWVREYVERAR